MRSSAQMSSLADRLADIASTMLNSPSQVRLILLNPSRRIWWYVSQKEGSWMKGSSWPVFWKYCSIKFEARSSGGKAYIFTCVGAGDRPGMVVFSIEGSWERVTLTTPPGLCVGGDISENDARSGLAIDIARDIYPMKAMLDEEPNHNQQPRVSFRLTQGAYRKSRTLPRR